MPSSLKVYFVDDGDKPPVVVDAAGPPKEVNERLEKRPILIDLSEGLPAVEKPERLGGSPKFPGGAWRAIERNNHVAILLSLKSLQQQGAAVTHGHSWEQTVEDFGAELHLFPQLRALSHFRHLFLRVDGDGLIHVRSVGVRERASSRLGGRLYFAPYRGEAKCEFSEERLIAVLQQNCKTLEVEALECGLVCVQIPDFVLAAPLPGEAATTKRWRILNQSLEDSPVHRINVAVAIVQAGLDKVLNRQWTNGGPTDAAPDLWESLTRVEIWNPRDRAPDFVTLAAGSRPAMPPEPGHSLPEIKGEPDKGFTLPVPLVKIRNLIAAEREQIETLCSIQNLIKIYKEDGGDRHDKPLSIAVFAPPGAGKSFAVKEIAADIGYGDDDIIEFNVSQFRTPADLTQAFRDIAFKISEQKEPPPLAFFDEFDSALDNQELGWLRYFLAPMQDGIFYDNEDKQHPVKKIKRSILVFAGGIHTSFEGFDPRTSAPAEDLSHAISEEYRKEIREFEQRKGPDFISRLRGYINIADANAEPGRSKHFLRRAIQLRGLLENKLKLVGPDGRAKADEAVIYALLSIDRYHHGVRSMEAILRMCAPIAPKDDHIYVSSLPGRAQLNMHVDADEFAIRVHRGRSRAANFATKPGTA
jgi:hypothetical protein